MKKSMITRPMRFLALAGVAAIALPLAFGQFQSYSGPASAAPVAAPDSVMPSTVTSYRSVVQAAKPAVVTIKTEAAHTAASGKRFGPSDPNSPFDEFFRRFFDERGVPMPQGPGNDGNGRPHVTGLGSGFIISADGTIVTNNHVIDGAQQITVVLDDGEEYEATLVGRDPKTDLAVIRIKPDRDLPVVAWGDSDELQAGDPIVAIGNPFGIGTTVTAGIVSARGRDLHNGPYDDFIQVDAAINRGNSGGPLLDMGGKVVGVNSAIYSPNGGNVGVGFAIPSDQARTIVARLIEHGTIERGFIGVMIQPVTRDVAEAIGLKSANGALIAGVNEDSPAAKAGLKAGDVVTAFGKTEVVDPKSLSRAVADLSPGAGSTITVYRKGETKDLAITVGRMADDKVATIGEGPLSDAPGSYAVDGLGIVLSDLTDQVQADQPAGTEGAVVAKVDADSAAADELRKGDIILSVNQERVRNARNAGELIADARKSGKRSVLLLVERGEAQSFVAVPFARG